MGLVIDLSREAEEALAAEAAKRGMPAPDYARRLIEQQLAPRRTKRGRPPNRPAGRARFAGVPVNSSGFIARKQEEIDREDRGWRPASST